MNFQIIPLLFLCELIDSGLGMNFGAILSPTLVIDGLRSPGNRDCRVGVLARTKLFRNYELEYRAWIGITDSP